MVELVGMAVLHDVKNAFFRRIHNGVYVGFAFVTHLGNIICRTDESTQYGFFLHNGSVMAHICGAAHRGGDIGKERQAADLFKDLLFLQFIFHGNHVDGHAAMVKLLCRFKDLSMVGAVEILSCQHFQCQRRRFPIQKHGAQHCQLCRIVMGRYILEDFRLWGCILLFHISRLLCFFH